MVKKENGTHRRTDSVESFLQNHALSPQNHLVNLVDNADTDTASIVSTTQTDSSIGGLQLNVGRRPAQPRRPRVARVVLDNTTVSGGTSGRSAKQGMGRGKLRRYQNTLGLLTGIEEESIEENLAVEIAEANQSVLDELFKDASKMTAWQSFVKMSEEDQQDFLMAMVESDLDEAGYDGITDFATTAEECFKRIDHKLRPLVAHRSPPVDLIEPMENEVTGFFASDPQGVFYVEKEDTYQRMIFHAICQYFGLVSVSFKQRQRCRTKVRNRSKNGVFYQPPKKLSAYLAERYGLMYR